MSDAAEAYDPGCESVTGGCRRAGCGGGDMVLRVVLRRRLKRSRLAVWLP